MKHLGILKFFIETDENGQLYGVLLFDEDKRTGSLKYYNKGIEYNDTDMEHAGTLEWAVKIIKLAEAKCIELSGTLTTF